jgi:hypothetical protein
MAAAAEGPDPFGGLRRRLTALAMCGMCERMPSRGDCSMLES